MEAGKVDIISSPSRFVKPQEPINQPASQDVKENDVSWKTVGLISAAIMAATLGGIYYAKHHSVPKNISNSLPGSGAGGTEVPPLVKLKLEIEESFLSLLGKGKKVESSAGVDNHYKYTIMGKETDVELTNFVNIDENKILYYSDDNSIIKLIDKTNGDKDYHSVSMMNFKDNEHGIRSFFDFQTVNPAKDNVLIERTENSTLLSLINKERNLNYSIEFDEKTGKIIKAINKNLGDIPDETAQKLIDDFDINKYITDAVYREEFGNRFYVDGIVKPLSKTSGKSEDELLKLLTSADFQQTLRSQVNVRNSLPELQMAAKKLEDIFCVTDLTKAIENISDTEGALLSSIAEHKVMPLYVYSSNVEAAIEAGHIKLRDGISTRLGDVLSNGALSTRGSKVEISKAGRLVRYSSGNRFIMQYYKPPKVTAKSPIETSYEGLQGCCYIKEYNDKKLIEIINEDGKKVVLSYDKKAKKINPKECYAQIISKDGNLSVDITGKESVLNDIYGTFGIDAYTTNNADYLYTNNSFIAKLFE